MSAAASHFGKFLLLYSVTTVLWSCGADFFRPIRRLLDRKKNLRTIRKMMHDLDVTPLARCPACHVPFDKGKRRKFIDSCGHERCYHCLCQSEKCPLCVAEGSNRSQGNQSRPRLKTNGHFTTFMQTRHPPGRGPPTPTIASPKTSHVPWRERRPARPTTVSVDSHSALSDLAKLHQWPMNMVRKIKSLWTIDDEPQLPNIPTAKSTAQTDLNMRLCLLFGESASVHSPARSGSTNHSSHSQESYASVSSLASSDANTAASANTSPVSTLTGSSEAEALSILRASSREQSSDSVTSLMSTGSSPSPSHHAFGQRNNSVPSNRRGTLLHNLSKTQTLGPSKGQTIHYKAPQLTLKPLYFEVPQINSDPPFIGRQWLFKEIEQELANDNNRGVIISGNPGMGKTAIILQLVDYSSFGRKRDEVTYGEVHQIENEYISTTCSSIYQSRLSLTQEVARLLGGHVVGYHFCQADNNSTCLVPDFVHSIAAQLCQAPQLVAYRDLLLRDTKLQDILSIPSCHTNPHAAFVKGVLEPLHSLRQTGRIPNTSCLIVIDALNEAELHKPDYGDTIASFLSKHIMKFPSWLKIIATVRTSFQDSTRLLPFHKVSLDRVSNSENSMRDISGYVLYRIDSSPSIRANITVNNSKQDGSTHTRFANHLASLSKGCFLYVKLTLDLIEKGNLVVKSSSYKVLPVSLSEVYLLNFNLRFTTIKSYERVQSILQVCMASLYPLRPHELYHSVNAGFINEPLPWADFQQRLNILTSAQFLVPRKDDSLMLAHPSLREWLLRREENDSTKFLCDIRVGHAMIAFRMSRLESPLEPDQCLEFGHHILKAHIYKNVGRDLPATCSPRDLQAFWVFQSTDNVSSTLVALPNLYSPNVKVSRLLLLAQADPNAFTPCHNQAPILVHSACEGFTEMVSSLLEFGADVNATSATGCSALCLASQQGHLDIVRNLLTRGAKINHVDENGQSSLVFAASRGHLSVVSHLVQCDWPDDTKTSLGLMRAAQQALIAAARFGHVNVCEFMLDMAEVQINKADDLTGHTALTAASFAGHKDICSILLKRGASVLVKNSDGEPPLCCAVSEGHWAVAELLLSHAKALELSNSYGHTPLMLAAMEGHLGVLELLLSKGASLLAKDNEGLTALSWACSKGQFQAVQCLLNHGSDVNHTDIHGRTPLDMGALHGKADVVQLLLNNGAEIEHVDMNGLRALDRAIDSGNVEAVNCFLQKGAKIGSQTWEMAAGKPKIIYQLLNKLHQDGILLYKKVRVKEAAHRYQYALKKFPPEEDTGESSHAFHQLKHQLLVGLARCKTKLNEYDTAIIAASQAIELKPKSFEGYYVRARAKKEKGCPEEALKDTEEALRLVPASNSDARRTLTRLREEIASGAALPTVVDSRTSRGLSVSKLRSGSTDTIDQVCGISLDSAPSQLDLPSAVRL